MQQFPDWVPKEVVNYYHQLCAGEHPHDICRKFEQSDIHALCRCMELQTMEKAWQAISKRKEKVDPEAFAHAIVFSAFSCRIKITSYSYPTAAEIAKYERILKKLRALCEELDAAFEHWSDKDLKHFFGESPSIFVDKLSDDLSRAVFSKKMVRKHLKYLSGKPQSESGERTYIIRILSESVRKLYGQPLHKVVALTSSAILQEDVAEETARKLVS